MFRRDVSGQAVGAGLVSTVDGSAFSGAVTCFVTGDAGTQTQGTVNSGACADEGRGYYTYQPSAAETDFALVAFTFTGTNAVPATIQFAPVTT